MTPGHSQLGRLRRGATDLIGLFALPMLVAALPWPIGLAVLKRTARTASAFRAEADAAWLLAREYAGASAESDWKWRYRLIRWIERADTWLTLTRNTAWWQRHVDITGEYPHADLGWLLLTFHWGAGNWVWKLLRERGIDAHFLARKPGASDLGASRVALWYGWFRGWAFSRIGSLGPLYTGGSTTRIENAWQRGESIVAMIDLPVATTQPDCCVVVLGKRARLPSRLVQLSRLHHVPTAIFSCGFDIVTGQRTLRIEQVDQLGDMEATLACYAEHLNECLRTQPEFWLMWHETPLMFTGDEGSDRVGLC